jgi:hypothetical protein
MRSRAEALLREARLSELALSALCSATSTPSGSTLTDLRVPSARGRPGLDGRPFAPFD